MIRIKNIAIILLCFFAISTVFAANDTSSFTKKQAKFVKTILPNIELANRQILELRKQLVYLHFMWQEHIPINYWHQQWLIKLAKQYKVKNIDFAHAATWNTLLRRVDGLPNSLVLAQAINESAWGRSYFAREANNYFGQWCTVPGCGVIPRRRSPGATHEVKKYATAFDSVRGYMLNINTNRSYRKLRNLRQQLRVNHEILSGLVLVHGLSNYSQRGKAYVESLQNIIEKFNLEQYNEDLTLPPF
jgi:Bax protein